MSGGFWGGSIPPWAYCVFAAVCVLFLCTGELDGMRRGGREAREDEWWAREQAKARRTHPVYRQPPPDGWVEPPPVRHKITVYGYNEDRDLVGTEVAHDWPAHEASALAVANDQPDPRTDSQWTRDMAADMDRWLAGLLNAHPATEEL